MASIKGILCSYPWKNYKNLNWNRLFKCPKIQFAWLKLALWSQIAYFTTMNLWHFRRQSTLNVSQTWLQWNKFCAHVRGNIKYILTEISYLHALKIFCLIKTCALISNTLFYNDELLTFSAAVNSQCQSNMAVINRSLRLYPYKNI